MLLLSADQISASEGDDFAAQFVGKLKEKNTRHFFLNARAEHELLKMGGVFLPVTISSSHPVPESQSYVVSPRSAYGAYAREEVSEVPFKIMQPLFNPLISLVDGAMKYARADDVVYINNWLLSTNLYPNWQGEEIRHLADYFTSLYPDHFIAFRSLNYKHHKHLLDKLVIAGWDLLPSRQIWLSELKNHQPKKPRNVRNDINAMKKSPLIRVSSKDLGQGDYNDICSLYRQLYLDKYSKLNPDFTPEFIRLAHESNFLRLEALKTEEGRIVGVMGTIAIGDVMTTPLIGYDLSCPRSMALYRLLCLMAFEDMYERKKRYNLSAGAGLFKKTRGAEATIEYTAIFSRHLTSRRRLPIRVLQSILNRIGVPLITKWEL